MDVEARRRARPPEGIVLDRRRRRRLRGEAVEARVPAHGARRRPRKARGAAQLRRSATKIRDALMLCITT